MAHKYVPPHKRGQNVKTYQGPIQANKSLKLAPNEELLPDGRILIRGSLRKDGTKRPDRYKRVNFQNDEDLQRNKYITKGAKRRLIEQKEQTLIAEQNISNVIDEVLDNPPKQIISTLNTLLNDFYNDDKLLLTQQITKAVMRHVDISTTYVSKIEIINFIHQLLRDKISQRNEDGTKKKPRKECKGLTVRGRGNVSYGTGYLLSESIEIERKKAIKARKSNEKQMIDQQILRTEIKKLKLEHPADALLFD